MPIPVNSPFSSATAKERKIKLFLWGSWGVGKTTVGLQFPKPAVLDMDGGAELYGNKYNFDILKSTSLREIKLAVQFLIDNPGQYETLVLDPITIYWELVQKYWSAVFLNRIKGVRANKHEFFDLGPREWATIKADFKGLFDRLISLDMHVVVTARETVKYKPGQFMVADGVKYDGEKSIPYIFDTVLHLYRDKEKYMALCSKDRTESLPCEPFECSYKILANLMKIGGENATS